MATAEKSENPLAQQEYFTPKEAAAMFGVSVYHIYRACSAHKLQHAKLGHSTIRIKRDWLEMWAAAEGHQQH
jgi:excisionase family DNA binding protein